MIISLAGGGPAHLDALITGLLITTMACGCQLSQSGDDTGQPQTSLHAHPDHPPSDDVHDCLQTVLQLPADTSLTSTDNNTPEASNTTTTTIIPASSVLATDTARYILVVDSVAETARIVRSGGIADHLHQTYGPWKVTQPDVARLISVVTSQSNEILQKQRPTD